MIAFIVFILKLLGSLLLAGFLIGGLTKLSPAHRNPEASPVAETVAGIIGLGVGIGGLYYLWLV